MYLEKDRPVVTSVREASDPRLYPTKLKPIDPVEQPRVFITGISGQVGSVVAQGLVEKGCRVFGCDTQGWNKNITHLRNKINLLDVDLLDEQSIISALRRTQTTHLLHFAAKTHVQESTKPEKQKSYKENIVDVTNTLLRATQLVSQKTRNQICVYNAETAEIFGDQPPLQNEQTQYAPLTPYAIYKLETLQLTEQYKDLYNSYIVNGITANHEVPGKRSPTFFPRKVSQAVARIHYGLEDKLIVGNLDGVRGWWLAPEITDFILRSLQKEYPQNYTVGPTEGYTGEDLINYTFALVGLDWRKYVYIDKKFFRSIDYSYFVQDFHNALIPDPRKANLELEWQAYSTMPDVMLQMLAYDLKIEGERIGREPPNLNQITTPLQLIPKNSSYYNIPKVEHTQEFYRYIQTNQQTIDQRIWRKSQRALKVEIYNARKEQVKEETLIDFYRIHPRFTG